MTFQNFKILTTKTIRSKEFIKYLTIGGLTFALDFTILTTAVEIIDLNVELSTSLAYWISVFFNFALNRQWTFGKKTLSQIYKHLVAYALLLFVNYLATLLIVSGLASIGLHYIIGKILAVGITMVWNFIAYKRWIFKE